MIPIAKPQIDKEEKQAVISALDSGFLAQGPRVEEFEKDFASFVGTKYAVATSSGTTALYIALLALGIGPGDEVITSPFTFIASANSILYTGAKPVFVDIKEDDFNIDPLKIEEKITNKTKAIMPIHLYGQPADMEKILEIAQKHNLFIIEDACQAHGAKYKEKMAGSLGDVGCFSFYPTKNMTTGEGGIITTNDQEVCEKAQMLRAHGSKERYYHDILGFNFRMTDIGASIGIEQLKKLPLFNKKRQENAQKLKEGLKNIKGIITPQEIRGKEHVFHQYTIRVTSEYKTSRDNFAKALEEKGIGTGIHYPLPIHKQELYINLGYKDPLPVSEKMAQEVISLPCHPSVTKEDISYITQTIREI